MAQEIIESIIQVVLFAFIPFLFYLFRKKTVKGFFLDIGLKSSNTKANLMAIFVALLFAIPLLGLALVSNEFKAILFDPNSISGFFRGMNFGPVAIFLLLLIALIKTAFAEELFFRGFVAKKLIRRFGYQSGNIIQAILFGLIHSLLFLSITKNIPLLFIIFLVPTTVAYVIVYLNEKLANGSIIPGWIAHGLSNLITYSFVGFVM